MTSNGNEAISVAEEKRSGEYQRKATEKRSGVMTGLERSKQMTRQDAEKKILDKMLEINEIYKEYAGNTDCLILGIHGKFISAWNDGYKDAAMPQINLIYQEGVGMYECE